MGQPWPELVHIGRDRLTELEAVLVAQSPTESCALLLGTCLPAGDGPACPPALRIEAVWPCLNVWEPASERPRRFAVDPREQLLSQKWGRRHGWQLIGTAHSHPLGEALPSDLDRSLAFPPALMLIASGLVAGPGRAEGRGRSTATTIRAWWLSEPAEPASGLAEAHPLPLGIEDLGE
ncbi:M67 family metallopeptidase [Synechococcus sp. CS-602]|uniref:M67 family metallopeptidase n=1 Tax=Synechococcaceae TaxID=1890426 RepID=UPI0008FF7874|nr:MULTISPECIES: M67 family metallopeptidase [Synechococcaceae]MCT4364406.1 M67 family metallopeptidase [Candidatus Regnicoccus frigidus MAG-AL1]APD48315.1 hypothetical protein BM449_08735 [Synechococcus sp. SynAce01]MCT0201520.1 M67 family metallopeptidase [Synechococcus sp. CS-603]MCT0206027.1 M67 family metallopeptidase [Synechococcus sp. CS-602]MCT0244951.1 M67 family metallopeptidase [Synechococcus sp. CS-601]